MNWLYRAYEEGVDTTVSPADRWNTNGYTFDPYAQPEKFHNAIALLEAAATSDMASVKLKGVGTRRVYPHYAEVDYHIEPQFLKEGAP